MHNYFPLPAVQGETMSTPPQQRRRLSILAVALTLLLLAAPLPAHASITVLIGEPFGSFGTMMPVGHTTLYLDHVCADGPLKLRLCQPGETPGVTIARYDHLGPYDWIVTPIFQFLYATDSPADIPAYATPEIVAALREQYRRQHLEALFPDATEHSKHSDEWVETIGAAYDRRLYGYQLATTAQQDQAMIDSLNESPNRHNYQLHDRNCADLIAVLFNDDFPGLIRRNKFIDFTLTTPKNIAHSIERYGLAHPDSGFRVFEVPQVPGSLRRSRPVRGAAEMLLKQKRYAVTLAILTPEAMPVLYVFYRKDGRWQVGHNAQPVPPETFLEPQPPDTLNEAGMGLQPHEPRQEEGGASAPGTPSSASVNAPPPTPQEP